MGAQRAGWRAPVALVSAPRKQGERTMVFLDTLVNLGCRRRLHRETFFFSEEISQNIKEGENASIRDVRPAEYPLLGYQDRDLEDEYLDDMTYAMKSRILVGYVASILVFFLGPLVQDLSATGWMDYGEANPQEVADAAGLPLEVYLDTVENMTLRTFVTCGIVLAVLVVGLGACVAIYQMKRIKSKQPVLYITGAVYLIYITVMAYDFSWSSQIWWGFFGPASWIIKMIFYEMSPLISLLFMGLPFLATLELVGAATLAFLVIVPLLPSATSHYLWEMFDFVNLENKDHVLETPYCVEHEEDCVTQIRWILIFPFLMAALVMLVCLFVSYMVERANRRSFEGKKIMQCQKEKLVLTARLREEFLVSEHKRKEELIVDLFENF